MVTGASSGLRRATALDLARAGADVTLLARSEVDLRRVAGEAEALGRRALVCPVLGGQCGRHGRRQGGHRSPRAAGQPGG
nr:SDR family NAD(P)-dependent oxidoreductase [Deinococcus budaensis]